MNSTFLMLVCVPCAAVLSVIWFFAALNEKGVNPFYEVFGRFRKQSLLGLLLIPFLVVKAICFGSNKAPTNDAPGDATAPTNAPLLTMAWPRPQTPDPWLADRFTSNELASGSVLWRTGTNEVWNFDLMPEAHVVENWRLRGAADDWAVCVSTNLGPVVMTTDGRLVTTNGVFTAYDGRLAVVPEANWGLLGTNAPSCVWWADTPWESAVFTWQNVLADRDTNTPVSVQAEFTREGDFIFRYDLAATGTNLTSELYYRLRPEDMESDDRDGDGMPTADEIKIYHTDPGLVDTDGDGLLDDDEISAGTDPAARSVPNAEIVARVTGSATNAAYATAVRDDERGLVSLKLWDGFAADWPTDGTNLVYERTLSLGTQNGLHHYYLSSREMEAGGWDLRGLVLEWDDGCGLTGTICASRMDDSYRLPLTNATVTIRLRAIGPKIRAPKPMYLIGYTPLVSVSGGTSICDETGRERAIVCEAGEYPTELEVVVDRSNRPCKTAPSEEEAALSGIDDIEGRSRGAMSYEGDGNGGLILMRRPGCCQLPEFTLGSPVTAARRPRLMAAHPGSAPGGGKGTWILCLDPYISYGGDHVFIRRKVHWLEGVYAVAEEYPLDGMCLWRGWEREVDGDYKCQCRVVLEAGGGLDELPFVTKTCTVEGDVANGSISVFGETVWTGTAVHSWRDVGGHGGRSSGSERLSGYDECEECVRPCEDGNCDALSGAKLNSVAFRLSLGVPRMGQHSGFLFFESDEPLLIEPSVFALKARADAAISCVTSGASTVWRCADARGRDVAVAPIVDGVRLTVTTHATGAPDESWEIVNEGGDTNVVRMVQLSRLDNVMSDVTFVHDDGVWSKTDNVTGVTEVMEKVDLLNDPSVGKIRETRTKYDADGNQLDRTYVETSLVGLFSKAVLRETYWEKDTGSAVNWREASYWDDPANVGRHGQLRLLTGNCTGWEYHDYTPGGFETLRVEQRNGSPVPSFFPEVIAGDLYWTGGLDDATVTVLDYTPFEGDDGHAEDNDRPRCETRYVVRNGNATLVGRTWTRYTRISHNGYEAVRAETWRAALPRAARTDAANAYSYVITYSETAEGVPLVLRGEVAEEMDEDGVLTCHYAREDGSVVVDIAQKSYTDGFPTYDETETDAVRGTVLRRATRLSSDGTLLAEERSSYDEKDRLCATAYSDGTSLTNAYSCCRLLWSADREGRRTLRSAVTGLDGLYYADEEVWLAGLSSNGEYRVVQHFFDGLGRETNTVTFAGGAPGAYVEPDAACGSNGCARISEETSYPFGGDDCSVSVDARGRATMRERSEFADRTETLETVSWGEGATTQSVQTLTTAWRNGAQVTERRWDDRWTREIEWEDYDSDGCAVRYEVTESSDCGTVTNRVTHSDFLGRTVLEETPLGTTATTYQGATGRADVTTVAAGGVTRVSTALYNARGEEVGSVQDGVTSRTDEAYEPDSDGNLWKVTRSSVATGDETASATERREQLTGRAAGVVSRRIDIDADGVVEETVERTGAAEGERVTSVSNAVTGVRTQTRRYGVALETATPDETRRFAVDAFGRKVAETRQVDGADGIRVLPCEELSYDAFGDVVMRRSFTNETGSVTETYGYDGRGRKVSSVDALGNETVTAYDAVGNVVERRGATWPVRYGYDTAGRRVSLSTTKDGRIWDVTTWAYDPNTGKCTAKRYPDGSQVAYACTPDGLPFVTTKASGAWARNVYDEKRQLVGTVTGDGAGDAAFAYDAFGKMTAATNGVSQYVYARHRGGIVTNEWVDLDGDVQIVRTVDGFGRLAGRGVSASDLQAIAYDGQGRVAAVSSAAAVATYTYGAGGVDAGYALALNGGATIERRVVRDAYRPEQIVAVSNFVNGAAVGGESYARDAKGRIVERVENVENVERVERVEYDAIGQVVCETIEQSEQSEQSNNYSYDLIGNIAGSAALAYTVDGEVTGVGGLTFGYDAASRLTTVATGGVTIATYGYDAFDRRVRKTTPEATTTYLYDGWNLVREEIAGTNGTTDVIEYYWGKDISGSLDTSGGIGGLLYLKRNGAVYVPLYDASGNVTAYVDAVGNIVVSFTYDAFGNCTVQSNNPNNRTIEQFSRFRYSTKYHDAETGLIYYGYRYYAPTTARWLTRDPLEEQGGLNLHCFCENDGVNKVDWLGQVPEPTAAFDMRRFWRKVADKLREKGYKLSALFLERALESKNAKKEKNGGNIPWRFKSDVSGEIKKSTEFKNVIAKVISALSVGRHEVQKEPTNFPNSLLVYATEGDLKCSVKEALIKFLRGTVCKTGFGADHKSGSDTVFLVIDVNGSYSYAKERFAVLDGETVSACEKNKEAVYDFDWVTTIEEK